MISPVRRKHAFSLIEMLVVIGIIGVLAALIFPAIEVARRQANVAACASNLRQVGVGVKAYLLDKKGVFPPVADWRQVSTIADYYRPYLGDSYDIFRCPAQRTPLATMESLGLNLDFASAPDKWVTYEFNGFFANPGTYVRTDTSRDITDPTVCAYLYDYPYDRNGTLKNHRAHHGGINVLYCDWHVGWVSDTDAEPRGPSNPDGTYTNWFWARGHL